MTAISRTPRRVRHDTKLRLLQVARVERISPRMRRVTLAGETLEGFVTASPDDHVKLFFPAPGQSQPLLPSPGSQDAPPRIARDFTPRRYDPVRLELDIDFVDHGHGPASLWAAAAKPGDWLGVGGPRGSTIVPDDYDAYVLVADETGLPAVARFLEEMPAGKAVIALLEVADAQEERALPTAARAQVDWLHRGDLPSGTPGLLDRAIRDMDWPMGDVHVWIAAEIEVARGLRSYLVEQRGLSRDRIRAAGYWRLGAEGEHARIED